MHSRGFEKGKRISGGVAAMLVHECYCYQGGSYTPRLAWVELIYCSRVDQFPVGSLVLMWVVVRVVGFRGSNLMKRLHFPPGTRRGYSVSLITSLVANI